MSFSISATFRFGYYQGHDSSGRTEKYPNAVRLQCAFASAAYSFAAYEDGESGKDGFDDELGLPENLAAAICWFEDNPPDAIEFPKAEVPKESPKAHRLPGNWKSNDASDLPTLGNSKVKKEKDAAPHVSMGGPMVWWWNDEHAPGDGVRETLKKLAAEIPYLGEACSPVKISVSSIGEIPPDACIKCADGESTRNGVQDYRVPSKGNARRLQQVWEEKDKEYEEKKLKQADKEVPDWTPDRCYTACCDYRLPAKDGEVELPWGTGFLLEAAPAVGPGTWRPEQRQWKDWACAIHGALVKRVDSLQGSDLPAFLSGRGEEANNMSIQILPHDYEDRLAIDLPNGGHAVLLMLPSSARSADVSLLWEKLERPLRVYLGRRGAICLKNPREVDLGRLWRAPEKGTRRCWQPMPLYVADNRAVRRKDDARPWTIADSIKVSLGYVYRDLLKENQRDEESRGGGKIPRGDAGRLALLQRVEERGVKVEAGYPFVVSHPRDYAHHMNKDAHFTAGTGLVDLGELAAGCETLALAMGQSRHFSGGFLVPVDVPANS